MPENQIYLEFSYQVVRLWEQPVEFLLAGGIATLPLAPLAAVSPNDLPDVIRRMEERLTRETTPGEAAPFWTATYLLLGLRYPRDFARELLKGVHSMKDSDTYQEIIEEGEARGLARGRAIGEAHGRTEGKTEEARKLILRIGSKRFGAPDAPTEAALNSISEIERLERLAERLLEVENWAELLANA